MNHPAATAARDAVFLSYSHDDQDWRRKFTQILAPLVRNRRLELWDDTHIPAGDDWRRDIDDGVRRAGAALLLVTGSYLASRFIMEEELPALVAHGVRLVPVLVGGLPVGSASRCWPRCSGRTTRAGTGRWRPPTRGR